MISMLTPRVVVLVASRGLPPNMLCSDTNAMQWSYCYVNGSGDLLRHFIVATIYKSLIPMKKTSEPRVPNVI